MWFHLTNLYKGTEYKNTFFKECFDSFFIFKTIISIFQHIYIIIYEKNLFLRIIRNNEKQI